MVGDIPPVLVRSVHSFAGQSSYSCIKPRRVAVATASVRLTTSNLEKMLFTCALTVPSLMNNSAPISLLLESIKKWVLKSHCGFGSRIKRPGIPPIGGQVSGRLKHPLFYALGYQALR